MGSIRQGKRYRFKMNGTITSKSQNNESLSKLIYNFQGANKLSFAP